MMRFRVPACAQLVLVALLCRCGGAAPPPATSPSSQPSTVEEENQLEGGQAAPAAAPATPAHTPGPETAPPAPPPPSPSTVPSADQPAEREARRLAARAELDRAEHDLTAAAADCDSACRALASMDRATTHLCSLADLPDDRRSCEDARQRLSEARGRVRAACGACK